jgi:hypothetical protein
MAEKNIEQWDLWYPKGGATGISFARSSIDPTEVVLVHAAPQSLTVTVRNGDGALKAEGEDLEVQEDTPMSRLRCTGGKVKREDIWPSAEDIGRIVILPGGEAGVLKEWWHAPDHSEWRWQIELYNRREG